MIYPFYNRLSCYFVLIFLLIGTIGQAQPSNDNCEQAQLISKSGTYSGTTIAATADIAGEICNDFRGTTKGVWYKIIGNGGTVNLSTCGVDTNFDTWLGVYKGNCGSLTCVAENDDLEAPCIFTQEIIASKASELSFEADSGVVYTILVGGVQLKTGTFTLGVFCKGGAEDCFDPLKLKKVTRKVPLLSLTNANELVFLATFNGAVTGVDAADFKVMGTTASIDKLTKLTDSTYELTVKGGNLADLEGEVSLTIATTANIMDLTGNALTPEAPDVLETYLLDNTAPLIAKITRNNPTTAKTNADELTFLATFNEPVVGVDAADFMATGTTAALEVSTVTSRTYEVMLKGGDLAAVTGTVGLDFASLAENISANPTVLDSAGNVFIPMEPTIDEVYQVDNTLPTVTINQAKTQGEPTNENQLLFEVLFSEAVTGFTTGDITLGGTAGATTATVTGSDRTYMVAISGMLNSGTVIPSIAADVAMDVVGNNNIASTSTDNEVIYDITAPTLVTLSPLTNSTKIATNTNLTIQFDEPIQKGSGFIRIYKKTDDSLVETIDINSSNATITDSSLTVSRAIILSVNTVYYVQLTNGGIQDLAGNAHAGITTTTAWSFRTVNNIITIKPAENSPLLENADGTLNFELEATVAPNIDLTINYTLSGTATNGTDYDTLTGKVVLTKGMRTVSVEVNPLGDTTIEPDESVTLTLATGNEYAIGTPMSQTGMIRNDDFCPLLGAIGEPADICQGARFDIQIDGLEKMTKEINGNQDFGIQWVAFSETTENPYDGGINLGVTTFNELTGVAADQTAALSMERNTLPAGDYVIYAILSPLPLASTCRPLKKINLTVKPLPLPKLAADVPGLICSGTNVQFTGNGGVAYEFLLNNSRVQQGTNPIYNHTNLRQGDAIKVIATNELGCRDTAKVFIARVNSTDTDKDEIPDCRDVCPGGNDLGDDDDMDGVPDDCDCDSNNADDALVEVMGLFGQIPTGIYKAGSEISTIHKVNKEIEVTFQAGVQILLKPGFSVVAGGLFHALIAPCKNPNVLIEETKRTLPIATNFPKVSKSHPLALSITPNPLVNQTTLNFSLPRAELVSLFIYDQTGRIVRQVLTSQALEIGNYKMVLTKEDLKRSGFYYVVLETLEKRIVQKLIKID